MSSPADDDRHHTASTAWMAGTSPAMTAYDCKQLQSSVAVIGAGPAGLMAAEVLATAGLAVTVYDHLRTPARKLLMAGRGGLNLTHSEEFETFVARYGPAGERLRPALKAFPPTALRAWCEGLGQPTFVGSSGRVFPVGMKAAPLLRAWLRRLNGLGVAFRFRRRWQGWDEAGRLIFTTADGGGVETAAPMAAILALGGASWPRLGSDGGWTDILARRGVTVAPLRPANCGFEVPWSAWFSGRFAGTPLKPVTASFAGHSLRGEVVVTARGLEGGPLYALGPALRAAIDGTGSASLVLDLRPGLSLDDLTRRLAAPRGSQSRSTFLRKAGGLAPVAIALLAEAGVTGIDAGAIKALPLRLTASAPIERAISSAGGVALADLDEAFMLRPLPGVFAAGEMLDWEAPTGGYLLTGSFATGRHAGLGAAAWVTRT